MEWTADQKKVIETRGRNILVSAGAGSGKTAVLVERILSRIQDPKDPVNIDELLIVTFTRAAAAEMKERIEKALYEARSKKPDDEHLMRQTTLIHNAQITTIDGFCAYVVRNYGQTIGLVPGTRLMDEGETSLFLADALKEVLEEGYALTVEEGEKFRLFVETFAPGKSDKKLEDTISRLLTEAESYPDPHAYLEKCRTNNVVADPGTLETLPWMQTYMENARQSAAMLLLIAQEDDNLTRQADGPSCYAAVTEPELADYTSLANAATYEEFRHILMNFESRRLPSRPAAKSPEEKEIRKNIQDNRKRLSAERDKLKESFLLPLDEAAKWLDVSAGPLDTLIDVTEKLLDRYTEKKADKNVCDFSDQEHFALQILRQNGERTPAAQELSRRFREVMVDEYQDSNYLQEEILTAVSRNEDGEQDYFCVGDVKQSIYRFRQARPELFMEKYARYHLHPEDGVRIDLHQNFRSRHEVIDTVNGIFSQIMGRDVGGVLYDEDAALVTGASYPEGGHFQTEILPVCQEEETDDGEPLTDSHEIPRTELEARAVGKRIREMVGHEKVFDQKAGTMRPVEYRDIVILLRSPRGSASTLEEVLTGMGIPVYVSTRGGYFDAPEVMAVLNFLSIIDNPEQDYPFLGVMRSAFVGLNADALASIRMVAGAVSYGGSTKREDISLYDAARAYADHGTDSMLKNRLEDFFAFYDDVRESVPDTPLHELIYRILTETGYLDYVSALPGGAQRVLNLRMLIDRARTYESGSYIGLFNFVRYIENLRAQDVDLGELSTISENDNVVRVMSIHKSKGLEFPVVFVSGLSHRFNKMDLTSTVLIHPSYGVASDAVDIEKRVKTPTLKKLATQNQLLHDTLGEELRVLYVAMTRAKQKLILTGTVKDEKAIDNILLKNLPLSEPQIPVGAIVRAGSYFTWIIPAADRVLQRLAQKGIDEDHSFLTIHPLRPSDLAVEEMQTSLRREDVIEKLASLKKDQIYDRSMRAAIEERFSYRYPHEGDVTLPVEISVSDLKKGKYSDAEEDFSQESNAEPLYKADPVTPLVPDFILKMREDKEPAASPAAEDEGLAPSMDGGLPEAEEIPFEASEPWPPQPDHTSTGSAAADTAAADTRDSHPSHPSAVDGGQGARRGTAVHRVLELLDFSAFEVREDHPSSAVNSPNDQTISSASPSIDPSNRDLYRSLKSLIDKAIDHGRIDKKDAALVPLRWIVTYLTSPLGRRVIAAAARGDLFRERPFVLGVPASDIRTDWPSEEMVFVQGIIDAYFIEENRIVLLDYKTDYVKDPSVLIDRYDIQIREYAEALRRSTQLPVTEAYLWSFRLARAIPMDIPQTHTT
ncbi:MAG: helicase-exonuclease AddAB subunit AddA [Lachnospiraceae bacterium]|nr:helicase-exonuclease AddAB subunit AddA [Lachnospiraceae bacterium]